MSDTTQVLADMHWQYDLLGTIEVGIVVINRDFQVEMWNQFMENHSGKLPSGVVGKNLFDVFPEIDKAWLSRKAQPVFDLKTPAFLISTGNQEQPSHQVPMRGRLTRWRVVLVLSGSPNLP